MPTPKKATTAKKAATKAETKRSTQRADQHFPTVLQALKGKKDGLTLKQLEDATGIDYRVLHNVTWRLEGSPEVRNKARFGEINKPTERAIERVGEGRTVRYKAIVKRVRKTPAKATA
jgi:hypothetical protein